MKKIVAFCFLLFAASLSFAQIHKGEAETKNGSASFLFHYVEYLDYRYLFFIDGVSVFLDEDNMEKLQTALDKFAEWEEIAQSERITLTKTIDSITFTGFHYDHTFFREPVTFYLVFTGGPPEAASTDLADNIIPDSEIDITGDGGEITADSGADFGGGSEPGGAGIPGSTNETPAAPSPYTLFVDTTLDRIAPFRLSSKTVHETREALRPEKLIEALDAYERQKALEEMFQ